MHRTSSSRASVALVLVTGLGLVLGLGCQREPAPAPPESSANVEPPAAPPIQAPAAAGGEPAADQGEGGGHGTAPASSPPPAEGAAGGASKPAPKKAPPPTSPAPAEPKEPAGYSGPDPCRATSFEFGSVRNACNKGGMAEAKRVMKGMVKRAKDQGKDLKCSSCHDNTKTYTKKPNAVEDMRALQ